MPDIGPTRPPTSSSWPSGWSPRPDPASRSRPTLGRSSHTEVKVFGRRGRVAVVGRHRGVGVRVVVDGRQGFAYAGSLDASIMAEVLAEARDNAGFGSVDEFLGLVAPDGVDARRPRPVPGGAGRASPPTARWSWPSNIERATRAADPRIRGLESAAYGDSSSQSAIASTEGVRTTSRRTELLGVGRGPGRRGHRDPDRLRLLGGPQPRASSTSTRRRPRPPSGPPGCWAPASPPPAG